MWVNINSTMLRAIHEQALCDTLDLRPSATWRLVSSFSARVVSLGRSFRAE
jgi:hypothetical protein